MADSQYVVFALNQQTFGIELFQVREVFSYRKTTPLPEVDAFVQGIINLRGLILPVFELRHKFHLPVDDYTSFHVIITVETARRVLGIIADEITDVLEILPEEFQTAENLPPGLPREFLTGVGRKGEQLILLLDVDRLLSAEEFTRMDASMLSRITPETVSGKPEKQRGETAGGSEEPKHGQDIGNR